MSELMVWAGLPKVWPNMSLAASLQAVSRYQQMRYQTLAATDPQPLATVGAIRDVFAGLAIMRERGDEFVIWRRQMMHKLKTCRSVFLMAAGCQASLGKVFISQVLRQSAKLQSIGSQSNHGCMRTGACRLPARVIQVADDAVGIRLGRADGTGQNEKLLSKWPRKLRDVLHLCWLLRERVGKGVVLSASPEGLVQALAHMGAEVRVIGWEASNLAGFLGTPLDPDTRWGMVPLPGACYAQDMTSFSHRSRAPSAWQMHRADAGAKTRLAFRLPALVKHRCAD